MKKILCFIAILIGCQFGRVPNQSEILKADVSFAKWPGKNEPMRVAPVLLNLFRFPTITDKSPFTRKSLAKQVIPSLNKNIALRSETQDTRFRILMHLASGTAFRLMSDLLSQYLRQLSGCDFSPGASSPCRIRSCTQKIERSIGTQL